MAKGGERQVRGLAGGKQRWQQLQVGGGGSRGRNVAAVGGS